MHHNKEFRKNHNTNKRISFLENFNKNRKHTEHQELRNDEESRNNQKFDFSASIRNNRMSTDQRINHDINEIDENDEFEREMAEIEEMIGNKERLILNQRWTENEKVQNY